MNEKNDVSWLITDSVITVSIGGKTHMLARTDSQADKLIDALKNKRYDEVPELVSVATLIEKYTEGAFKVEDGEVLVDGEAVHGLLATKIKEFHSQGLPYMPLVKFARNVRKNPLPAAVDQLFEFLERFNHPITEEGDFIAYKTVRSDMYDHHSGTVKYELGVAAEMPRAEVQHNPAIGCSTGLHVASWNYASSFMSSGVMLKCVVSPIDVISVPTECEAQKMRCCRITPIEIVKAPSNTLLDTSESE
jgi:hypothetical protein